jgi:N-acetylmuramoyl-L-alanine amidase
MLAAAVILPAPSSAFIDVWIDPGHGGNDPGNPGYSGLPGGREKVINLQVSSVLSSRLAQVGYSSLKTRNADSTNMTKVRRADIATGLAQNDLGQQEIGQMFISVHMNAGPSSAFGTETYYSPYKKFAYVLDSYRVDSTFAAAIHSNMMSGANLAFLGCNSNRGVKYAAHTVTKRARVPGVLVEVCFTTNQCQQGKIEQQGNQALIANGIAAGISQVIAPGGTLAAALLPGSLAELHSAGSQALTARTDVELQAQEFSRSPGAVQSLQEGFEGTTFPPPGWTTLTTGQPVPFRWHRKVDPLYVHAGVAAARVGPQSSSAIDEWLISPAVLLGTGDTGLRFFWNGNRNHAQAVNSECLVRPAGSGPWTQVWSLQSEPSGTEFQYRERVVTLAPWAGTSIEIAFRVSGTNGAEFVLDDVAVGTYAPTAAPPNDMCSGAIAIAAGTHEFTGSTCYAADNLDAFTMAGSCAADSLNSPDVFFWVSAAAGDTLQATVTGAWSPTLYLVTACSSAAGQCVAATPTWQDGDITTATLSHIFSASGVYYLVVDGVIGECGDYLLSTHIRSNVTGVPTEESTAPPRSHLTALPNPSGGSVRIFGQRESSSPSQGYLRVFTVSGRLAYQRPIYVAGDRYEIHWDGLTGVGARLSSGVYVIKVTIGSQTVQTRLVVAR